MTQAQPIRPRDAETRRELEILDLFGTQVDFGPERMIEMLRQPVTQIFL